MAVRVITLCFLAFLSVTASADSLNGKVVKIFGVFVGSLRTIRVQKVSPIRRVDP